MHSSHLLNKIQAYLCWHEIIQRNKMQQHWSNIFLNIQLTCDILSINVVQNDLLKITNSLISLSFKQLNLETKQINHSKFLQGRKYHWQSQENYQVVLINPGSILWRKGLVQIYSVISRNYRIKVSIRKLLSKI